MKTEQEIRRHRDNLRIAMVRPCDCAATGHTEGCRRGGEMMAAAAGALGWVLGDDERAARVAEHLNDQVETYRAAQERRN